MAVKKELYNVAIAGQGYILAGTPDNPARRLEQAPVYGARFASGDRDYTDFSLWWYWAQTDWSGGIKQTALKWEDDARFFYSYNIDTWTEYGSIRLARGLAVKFNSATVYCGYYGRLANTSYLFIGVGGSPPAVYRSSNYGSSWTNITGSNINTDAYQITQIISHKNSIWVGTGSTSSTTTALLHTTDGSSWSNHTSSITTALSWADIKMVTCMDEDSSTLYVGVERGSVYYGIVSTSDEGANWSVVMQGEDMRIVDIKIVGTKLYCLFYGTSYLEFGVYDTSSSAYTKIWSWDTPGGSLSSEPREGKLFVLNGKIVIFSNTGAGYLWEYDPSSGTLTNLLGHNVTSIYPTPNSSVAYGVIHKGILYLPQLLYDGYVVFEGARSNDETKNYIWPIASVATVNQVFYRDPNDNYCYADSGYRTSGELVFNRIEPVAAIDKIWHSIIFTFDKLSSGQKITFYYSDDERTTWTEIGGVDYSIDGGAITSKAIPFPENTVAKKIWLKVKLEGNGETTPVLRDVSIQYLPLPDYKQRWVLQVYCYDDIMLLDGKTREPKRGEELKNILKSAWWGKQVVDFHDIDYAETTLDGDLAATATTITVASTAGFPERGRIRIDDEEILYTGKTATTFTGCTRGARGTTATSHSNGATVSNGYKVLITNYSEEAPVGANAKIEEAIVTLELREV